MLASNTCTERAGNVRCEREANVYLHEMVTVEGQGEWLQVRPVCPVHASVHLLASLDTAGMVGILTTIPQPPDAA